MTRRILQFMRRGHLYLGLFLLPWALLYGVTGFLFNHPAVFPESPIAYFDLQDLEGTELEDLPSLEGFAATLIDLLNVHNKTGVEWTVGKSPVRYSGRDTFVATIDSGNRSFFFVFNPSTQSGFIRENSDKRSTQSVAPFATAALAKHVESSRRSNEATPLQLPSLAGLESIVERIQRSAPKVLESKGFPSGVATVTRSPEITFPVMVSGSEWTANYDPIHKHVSGVKGEPKAAFSWRSFLLRLHLSHHYPSQRNTEWLWAVGVDAIALTLCFWGLSGLVMWWQIKATRRTGAVVLIASFISAVFLGLSRYHVMAP